MKKPGIALAMLWTALAFVPAHAVTLPPATFPVNITLTSACVLTTAPGAVSFAYTSGQAGVSTATGTTAVVTCTNTLPYAVSVSTAGAGYQVTDQLTNLTYTLTLNGAANNLAATGTGAPQTITIGGTMAGGQWGTCNAVNGGTCNNTGSANITQTLTITY